MFRNVLGKVVTETFRVHRHVKRAPLIRTLTPSSVFVRSLTDVKDEAQPPYEAKTNELINEELDIAYPIIDGIPNMIPQEARLIQKDADTSTTPAQE
ncbi:hypothetical protein INR49_005105 [Caranx melampygus]|nr:hypothetical protein INR49_005105 [Caranx melampygus]